MKRDQHILTLGNVLGATLSDLADAAATLARKAKAFVVAAGLAVTK